MEPEKMEGGLGPSGLPTWKGWVKEEPSGAQWRAVCWNTKTQRTRRFRPDAVVHKVRLLLGGHEVMVISWKPNRGWEPGWSR